MEKTSFQKFNHKLLSDRKYAEHHMKKDVAADIAQMVLEARVVRGITQTELAKKIGTKQTAIARIENGHLPSLKVLEKITEALDMTFIILV